MSDIKQRLRDVAKRRGGRWSDRVEWAAADRIEALEAKLAVAREALHWYARDCTIGEDMAQRALKEIEQ